jgi:hypothetical protein
MGRGVVADEELERMDWISLLHLLLFFPSAGGFVVEDDVSVILGRLWVFYPEVAGGDLAVGQSGFFGDGGLITPGSAD